jgi:integrase
MQMDYDTFVPLPGVPNSQTENQGEAFEYNESEIKILLTEDQILQKLSVDELWCMLVLYYTGARLREITPMIGRDLLIVDGTEGLYIREDHALGRTVKNRASVRVVPLHPSLKELGFLSYAERNPQDAIFTSLWDTTGYRANKFSRKLKSLGIEHGFKPTIRPSHGFRHHVVGLWRKAEKRQDLQDAYLGHSQKSQQGRYSNFNSTAKAASEVWPELPDKDKLLSYLWPQE